MCTDSPRRLSADSVCGESAYKSHTVFCVHPYSACPANQAMSWSEAAAGMCAGYIFLMRRIKRPKYVKRFRMRRFFNEGAQHGKRSSQLTHTGWFRIREFRQDDEKCL
jgi:hypothetical protein